MRTLLDAGALVVLYPEGTSSDGTTVLPFKSSLFEPVAGSSHQLSAGCIGYRLADGDVGEELCYWRDMTFLPHLLNLLSKRRVEATVQFSEVRGNDMNRKELAKHFHSEILKLKGSIDVCQTP